MRKDARRQLAPSPAPAAPTDVNAFTKLKDELNELARNGGAHDQAMLSEELSEWKSRRRQAYGDDVYVPGGPFSFGDAGGGKDGGDGGSGND